MKRGPPCVLQSDDHLHKPESHQQSHWYSADCQKQSSHCLEKHSIADRAFHPFSRNPWKEISDFLGLAVPNVTTNLDADRFLQPFYKNLCREISDFFVGPAVLNMTANLDVETESRVFTLYLT